MARWLLQCTGGLLDSRVAIEEIGRGKSRELKKRHGPTEPPMLRDRMIERYLRIRTKTRKTKFHLNRVQQEYSRKCKKKNIILKARQMGITTYIAARFFVDTITNPGTLSVQVAHSQESAEEIFGIVKRFWERLPEDVQHGELRTSKNNVHQIVFPRLDSQYCVTTASADAGRGWTIQNLHCSELASWGECGEEALASLRAAVVPGGEVVLESTPKGAGGLFYEEWQRAEETGYERHFFPWWNAEDYVIPHPGKVQPLTEEEQELVRKERLTLGQIAWRRKKWATLRGMAPQEYAEDWVSCFRASGECVFDHEAIDRALHGSSEPLESRDNRRLMIFLPPQVARSYVMGVDPAGGGIDGDYSCAQVIDRETGIQCAELNGHFPPRELAARIMSLGRDYNMALIAVEKNNHGHGVLAHLRNQEYANVFAQKGQDGWLTTVVSRPAMIENMSAALVEEPMAFRSPRLLNECRTFVRYTDGSTGAAPGTHDDCVMALAIAWAVRAAEAGRGQQVQCESFARN